MKKNSKKESRQILDDIAEFEAGFEDGVFAVPGDLQIKVRALCDFCEKEGIENFADLTQQEVEQFVVRKSRQS